MLTATALGDATLDTWQPRIVLDTSCASAEAGYPKYEDAWCRELEGSWPHIKFNREIFQPVVVQVISCAKEAPRA